MEQIRRSIFVFFVHKKFVSRCYLVNSSPEASFRTYLVYPVDLPGSEVFTDGQDDQRPYCVAVLLSLCVDGNLDDNVVIITVTELLVTYIGSYFDGNLRLKC
jgi:hypothetical protein